MANTPSKWKDLLKSPLSLFESGSKIHQGSSNNTSGALNGLTRWASQSSFSMSSLKSTLDSIGPTTEHAGDDIIEMDPARVLPTELMLHVLWYIDYDEVLACSLVSRRWHEYTRMNTLWRQKYLDQGWDIKQDLLQGVSWKEIFKTRLTLQRRWENKQFEAQVLVGHTDSVYCVQFDEDKIVTGSRDRTIRVWNARSGQLAKVLGVGARSKYVPKEHEIYHTGSVLCLSYDEDIMVSGSSDTSCIIWDMNKLRPRTKLFRHSEAVLDVSLNSKYIVTCSKDSTLSVLDRQDPSYPLIRRFSGHRGPVNSVEVQGDYIASVGGDSIVKLWHVETGNLVREFVGHSRGLACVQLSVEKRLIVSGSNDDTIRVWNLDTGACLHVLRSHTALVRSVFLYRNHIISGSYDQTVKVWDLNTGALIADYDGLHSSWVFSAKGNVQRIITTSLGVKPVIMNFAKGMDQNHLDYIV